MTSHTEVKLKTQVIQFVFKGLEITIQLYFLNINIHGVGKIHLDSLILIDALLQLDSNH